MSYHDLLMSGNFAALEPTSKTKNTNIKLDENGYREIDVDEGNYFLLKDKTRAVTLQYRMKYHTIM